MEKCEWCGKELSGIAPDPDHPITGHICPECAREMYAFRGVSLSKFLDKFRGPVFMVDDGCKVISANQDGAKLLGKNMHEFSSSLIGDAMECEYSYLDGGCGKTEHCRTCTIRNTVLDTLKTGRGHKKVPAYPDLHLETGERDLKFLISTEKVEDAVILLVEEAE